MAESETDLDESMTFVVRDDDEWPLTPRSRFLLWWAISDLWVWLDHELRAVREGHQTLEEAYDHGMLDIWPRITRGQTVEWWEETLKSVDGYADRVRKGDDLVPRTVAEEAAIYLATLAIDEARDTVDGIPDLKRQFEALPAQPDDLGEGDYSWGEVLPYLTGDADVEMLWEGSQDGHENPEDETNRSLGIGDYRPAAWHRLFLRRVLQIEDQRPPS